MLSTLREQGRRLVLATSKPEKFAGEILAHFGLLQAFSFLGCATMDDRRQHKADVISHALASIGMSGRECVMVGDRSFDAAGAKANGMDCIGVCYGFGSAEELKQAGVLMLADTPQAVVQILQKIGY